MAGLLGRIALLAKSENITIGALEKKIGASKGVLSRAIQANTDIQSKWVEKIVENYPLYSGSWILTGNGDMKVTNSTNPIEDLSNRISTIIQLLGLQVTSSALGVSHIDLDDFANNKVFPKKPFDYCQFLNVFPEFSYKWLLTGAGTMFTDPSDEAKVKCRADELTLPIAHYSSPYNRKAIPLIPYDAFAGYGSESFQDLSIEDYYIVQEFKNADFLLRVKGDSMSPKFNGGDVIACKLIKGLTFWQWHKVYAICTRSQGILIKRVEEYPGNPAFITCCSDNPLYKPFQIHEDEICAIALVLGAIVIE